MSTEKKFNAKSTALEVIEGHNLTGYEAIVTGASSGIGVETVRALAVAGARVIIAARDLTKAENVAATLRTETKSNLIEVEKLELGSLKSVNEFVKRFLAKNRPLHLLINNAGIMACPLEYTEDGFELQIGTNHFGHFALTLGLIEALKRGFKETGRHSRVVNVSSLAHILSDVDLNDINFKKREYDRFKSYGQSKTANILFSIELTKRYQKDGIVSTAVMPGAIETGLQRYISEEDLKKQGWIDEKGNRTFKDYKTIEQGASTTIWAAVDPQFENKGGLYLENCSISQLSDLATIFKTTSGHLDYIYNVEKAEKLWKLSEELIKNPPKA